MINTSSWQHIFFNGYKMLRQDPDPRPDLWLTDLPDPNPELWITDSRIPQINICRDFKQSSNMLQKVSLHFFSQSKYDRYSLHLLKPLLINLCYSVQFWVRANNRVPAAWNNLLSEIKQSRTAQAFKKAYTHRGNMVAISWCEHGRGKKTRRMTRPDDQRHSLRGSSGATRSRVSDPYPYPESGSVSGIRIRN